MQFALNPQLPPSSIAVHARVIDRTLTEEAALDPKQAEGLKALAGKSRDLAVQLDSTDVKSNVEIFAARKEVQSLTKSIDAAIKGGLITGETRKILKAEIGSMAKSYEFSPIWVVFLVAFCLGLGTMVGWKRIVVTIGEKIGKTHLTYAQGASAELCAAATIGVSSAFNLPVSTTHVLSSGVAGTMVAQGGVQNLRKKTITNIALAWLLTLPVTMVLAALLFLLFRLIL